MGLFENQAWDTVRNASKSVFYSGIINKYGLNSSNVVERFGYIEPLSRNVLIQRTSDFFVKRNNDVFDFSFSGGSTGDPLIVPKSKVEQRFFQRMYIAAKPEVQTRRRGIRFSLVNHAHELFIPVDIHFHNLNLYDVGSFKFAQITLENDLNDCGVENHTSILAGVERAIRAFYFYTKNNEYYHSRLDFIMSSGQYVSTKWRHRYESHFNCKFIDRYAMTEIIGGATQVEGTRFYKFDPSVHPEVLSLTTGEPIDNGIGELILTGLFPFQIACPLLRYATGDLVLVNRFGDGLSDIAIIPLGRKVDALLCHEFDFSFPGVLIYQALDELEEVQRSKLFCDSKQIVDREKLGHPKYRSKLIYCDNKKAEIEVLIELKNEVIDEVEITQKIEQYIIEEIQNLGLDIVQVIKIRLTAEETITNFEQPSYAP